MIVRARAADRPRGRTRPAPPASNVNNSCASPPPLGARRCAAATFTWLIAAPAAGLPACSLPAASLLALVRVPLRRGGALAH